MIVFSMRLNIRHLKNTVNETWCQDSGWGLIDHGPWTVYVEGVPNLDLISSVDLKAANTSRVRSALKASKTATVRELAGSTGLSQVTVAAALHALVASGVALVGELVPSGGGRPSTAYHFRSDRALLLVAHGQEIGGLDHLRVRVVDLYGAILWKDDHRCDFRSLSSLEPFLDAVLEQFPSIGAMAFGLPGVEQGGAIVAMDYPELVGTRFVDHFQARYQKPVVIENDVNAAVLGTQNAQSSEIEVYLYAPLKYPPGAGIRVGERLLKGAHGFAGEISWLNGRANSWVPFTPETEDQWMETLSRTCQSLMVTVDPHRIVVWSEALDESRMALLQSHCERALPPWVKPRFIRARSFGEDVARGIATLGLELLEPKVDFENRGLS